MKRSPSFRHHIRNNSKDRVNDDRNKQNKGIQQLKDEAKKPVEIIEPESNRTLGKEKKFSGRCQLFIGNIPTDMNDAGFLKLFEKFGPTKDLYLCANRGFGFIRMETRHMAEKARAELDGYELRGGRYLRVRMACHSAAIKVKYLSPYISNELLEQTFSMFGEVEKAVVIVDDKGKPCGEGIVEFARKQSAFNALKRISEGVFLMTSQPRPIEVEKYEPNDETDGLPELFILKTPELTNEREKGARFAHLGTLEEDMGHKWKKLYQLYKEQQEILKKNFAEEVSKLEADQANLVIEQRKHMLMQDMQRRQEELRMLEKTMDDNKRRMEMMRQEDEHKRTHLYDDDMRRGSLNKDDMMKHRRCIEPLKNNDSSYMNRGIERSGFGTSMQPPPMPPNMDHRIRMGGLNFLGSSANSILGGSNPNSMLPSTPGNIAPMQANVRMGLLSRPAINNNNNGGLLVEPNLRPTQQGVRFDNAPPPFAGNSNHGSNNPVINNNNNQSVGATGLMRPNVPLLNNYNALPHGPDVKRPRRY